MIMNSPAAQRVRQMNLETLEHGRRLQEHCRNIDRLISLNNRRISRGLRPLPIPTPLVEQGRELMSNPPVPPVIDYEPDNNEREIVPLTVHDFPDTVNGGDITVEWKTPDC